MAEKNTGRGRKSSSNHSNSNNEEGGLGLNLNGAKMERLYDVLEALIDTLDMPRNKGRAIKYGIRAIGEFMTPDEGGESGGRRSGGSTRASLADDEQHEGSSTSRRG